MTALTTLSHTSGHTGIVVSEDIIGRSIGVILTCRVAEPWAKNVVEIIAK